jgi:hypothetical protein
VTQSLFKDMVAIAESCLGGRYPNPTTVTWIHIEMSLSGGFQTQTSHNIDCFWGSLCYKRTLFHLNCLTAQLSYEGGAAVEGTK